MADTLRLGVETREVVRDLEAIRLGLGREVGVRLALAATTIAAKARPLTPYGPGPRGGKDSLPHIRDTIVARGSRVTSTHPGAIVHERGGVIAPRGTAFRIKKSAMAARAGEAHAGQLERDMQDDLDRLVAAAGLSG